MVLITSVPFCFLVDFSLRQLGQKTKPQPTYCSPCVFGQTRIVAFVPRAFPIRLSSCSLAVRERNSNWWRNQKLERTAKKWNTCAPCLKACSWLASFFWMINAPQSNSQPKLLSSKKTFTLLGVRNSRFCEWSKNNHEKSTHRFCFIHENETTIGR